MKPVVIYAAALLVFLAACRKPATIIPDGVLKPADMVSVLADIHSVQAAASLHAATDTSFVSFADYAPAVFHNHGITAQAYDSSLVFYAQHPELLDSIYKEVIDELSQRQGAEEGRSR